jgi:serine/threonine protein kinase
MPFENFCTLWSLTSDVSGSEWGLDRGEGADVFEPLVALFEAWAARHAPLSGIATVLRIGAATQQLIVAVSDTSDCERCAEGLVKLDELEQQMAATESAAHRFRRAHEALAEAVTQNLEAGGGNIAPDLVEARDAAFAELQKSLQLLEECGSRLNPDALLAATNASLTPIEAALAQLERATGVHLATTFEDDNATSDANDDKTAVDVCGATLRRSALGILQRVQHSAASARRFTEQCFARDGVKMLQTASSLWDSICSIVALEGEGEDMSLSAVLRDSTPWAALLASTARRLAPLRATGERAGCLQYRATALRSEVNAFESGFASREHGALLLEKSYRAMRRARNVYRQLQLNHDIASDDDSDAGGVDPEELARQRDACRAATASRDEAARQLFFAAKAYHPETLVEQRKRLRLTGLSAVWSDRTLEEYDNCVSLARHGHGGGRHAMLKAMFTGKPCVLKLVQLQQGQALCKEAEILRRLNHPNIVRLDAAFVHDNFLYLHFPFAKHGDLQQYLEMQAGTAADARVSAVQLRRMARQMCEAAAYLAERSIVHCDVKPANIFVADEDGTPMPTAILGDFDVSHTASGRTATLTMVLQTRGVATNYTAGYAAPEVVWAQPGQPPRATSKLDVYGLGCVIYHMHMYPRTLPEPERLGDDVASRAGLFDVEAGGALPNCAVPAWAAAVPQNLIAGATRADPVARLSARELLQTAYMRQADGEYARVDVQRPAYWQYQEHSGSWLVRESAEVVSQVEKLMNDTARTEAHGAGRKIHDPRFVRFKVTSVQRVENSVVWSAYAARRRALADALAGEGYTLPKPAQRLCTSHFLYPSEGGSLEEAAGEVFLFHGTNFSESIASTGFDVRYAYAGAGAGAAYGRGVYFAESASKSDQYVKPSAGRSLTLVLARVCLGRCQVVRDGSGRRNAPFLPEVEGMSTPVVPVYYDSILTEVPGMRFREIVVGRDTAAYPELLVEYEWV